MVYQDLGALGWVQLAMHFNSNRNDFYNNPTFYPTTSTLTNVNGVQTGVTPFPLISGGPGAPNLAYSPTGSFTGTGAVNNAPPVTACNSTSSPPAAACRPSVGVADNDAQCSSFYAVAVSILPITWQ